MNPFRRRKCREPSEATKAREQAEKALEETRAETPRFAAFARSFIEIQEVNHLGQTAAKVLRGDTP